LCLNWLSQKSGQVQNIPTAVLYRGDGTVAIGNEALAESGDVKLINEDFKIDLGRSAPGTHSNRKFATATGTQKSAADLTDDFLYEVQKTTKRWLVAHGISECPNVVVAEPLSMHTEEVSPEWLANYRSTIRAVLEGKRVLSPSGAKVRFIPEPFAAFQYYRYGIRHQLVTQRTQMNVLVLDFGGGTCDVCIIETTKEGDISGSGRNKRPLAGKSLPVGGFNINRAIAEGVLRKLPNQDEGQVKTGLRAYRDWIGGRTSLDALDARYRAFIDNFHSIVHRVENLKLALCRSVTDWSLESNQRLAAAVAIALDMFAPKGQARSVSFSVAELRDIFVQRIYNPFLKPFLAERLKIGHEVLEGAPITAVLLSGGSANIGWLPKLMEADFRSLLDGAPFVQVSDYQQVVAQGLAVDCAREFATGSSDFKGITYNPLYLLLNPDETACDPRPFQSRSADLPDVRQRPGLLLPTANLMSSFVGVPMQWKVRLNRAPKHRLDYYFLQSSMDPNDISNLQNVEETTVQTPANCEFDSAIQVHLTVRSDGTAVPKFVYHAGGGSSREIAKEGRKFYVDMTDASGGGGEAYLGLDFGTSNTAISYIDRSWVQLIDKRAREAGWRELGELIELLPSPLAVPLARYIGDVNDSSPVPPGYSFVEAALCLGAYVSYAEYCCTERRKKSQIFKNFPHRSASYLWHMLKAVQDQMGARATTTQPFQRLMEQRNSELIDRITKSWADTRHELSLGERNELLTAVRLLANVSQAVFTHYCFGYFQNVQPERFSNRHSGRFRLAHGKPPYSQFRSYAGVRSFSEAQAITVNLESGDALTLTPLVIWYPCVAHPEIENGHCFFFDKIRTDGQRVTARYKAASFPCQLEFHSGDGDGEELLRSLEELRSEDPHINRLSDLRFSATAGTERS